MGALRLPVFQSFLVDLEGGRFGLGVIKAEMVGVATIAFGAFFFDDDAVSRGIAFAGSG